MRIIVNFITILKHQFSVIQLICKHSNRATIKHKIIDKTFIRFNSTKSQTTTTHNSFSDKIK
jgi:hypothetical protein